MKPGEVVCCMVLFGLLVLTMHKAQHIVNDPVLRNQPIETCWLRNSFMVYESKTKDSAGSWTLQHKSWYLCMLL